MAHVYYLLVANDESLELKPNQGAVLESVDGSKLFAPILHIESDDKDEIRIEMIKSIDGVLKYI